MQERTIINGQQRLTHEIEPRVEWDGMASVAAFTIDEKSFIVRKEAAEFVLLAAAEPDVELARVGEKSGFKGGNKFLSVLGDFLGVLGVEVPER